MQESSSLLLLQVLTIQYDNGIYRALFTKRPGALTQLAVILTIKYDGLKCGKYEVLKCYRP